MSRPDVPRPEDSPPFTASWQAEVFGLTIALHEKGVITWAEWAEALSRELHRPDVAADGSDYYRHWLAALENLLARKRLAERPEVDGLAAAWERAAHATPHGSPIALDNDPGS